jgi:hypothetical protein
MSRLARRKLTSANSYFSSKPAPITAVLDESTSWSWIVLRATLLVYWMLDLLAFLVGILWQNRLNYSGWSMLVIARQAIEAQRTSNGTTH